MAMINLVPYSLVTCPWRKPLTYSHLKVPSAEITAIAVGRINILDEAGS
jgi:hypothetical protein